MKPGRFSSSPLTSSDLITLKSFEDEEEGFIGIDDDGRMAMKVRVKEENDFSFIIVPRDFVDPTGGVVLDTVSVPLEFGQPVRFYHQRTGQFITSELDTFRDDDADCISIHLEKFPNPDGVFRILPAYGTVANDGDKITNGCHIRIEHVVSGFVLHLSESAQSGAPIVDLRQGVDKASVVPWIVSRSGESRLVYDTQVRLSHTEAGFISSSKGMGIVAKNPIRSDSRPSYKSLWIVEPSEDTPTVGEKLVHLDDNFYLRLFGSDMYLKVVLQRGKGGGLTGLTTSPKLSAMPSSPGLGRADVMLKGSYDGDTHVFKLSSAKTKGSLFRFHLVNAQAGVTDDSKVLFGEPLLLESVAYNLFLRLGDPGVFSTGNKYTHTEIDTTEKRRMKDSIIVTIVPPSMLLDYGKATEIKKALASYVVICKTSPDTIKEKKTAKLVSDALSQAINFCSRDTECDPFKREGTPITHRQSLLGRLALSDIVEVWALGALQPAKVLILALKAIKLIVRGSEKLGKRALSIFPLPDFSGKRVPLDRAKKIYSQVPVAATIIEMYQCSSDLCDDLRQSVVDDYVDLLEVSRDAQYFTLLTSLCSFQGVVIHSNQMMITQTLHRRAKDVLMRLEGKNVVTLAGDTTSVVDFVFNNKYSAAEEAYFLEKLRLYGVLLSEHNKTALKLLREKSVGLTWESAYYALSNELPPLVRASACAITLYLFLDENFDQKQIELMKVWHIDGTNYPQYGDAPGIGYVIDPDPDTLPPPSIVRDPKYLSEFIISYLHTDYNIRFDPKGLTASQPYLLRAVFELSKQAFYAGILKKNEAPLVRRFKDILSIRQNWTHDNKPRILELDHINILNDVKLATLGMLDRYINLIVADRFDVFLCGMVKDMQGSKELLTETDIKDALASRLIASFHSRNSPLTTKNCDTKVNPPLGRCLNGFIPVLVQLLADENRELNSAALRILKRVMLLQSFECTMLKLLSFTQILAQEDLFQSFRASTEHGKKIQLTFLRSDVKQEE